MLKPHTLLVTALLLVGCQNTALQGAPAADTASKPTTQAPAGTFRGDTLYSLLAAEFAVQRGDLKLPLNHYLEQARRTHDPGVAERAYQIADYTGDDAAALETAMIWVQAAPDNPEAQRAAATQLARAGRYDEAIVYMEKGLAEEGGDPQFDVLAISAENANPQTRQALMQSFERLREKYPDNPKINIGQAALQLQDKAPQKALEILDGLPDSTAESTSALLLRIQTLQTLGRSADALPVVRRGVEHNPDDQRLRLAYARLLVENGKLEDAKNQFDILLQQSPDDDGLRLSVALLEIELEQWSAAIAQLQTLIEREAYVDTARYNLGQAYVGQNQLARALTQYHQVGPSKEYIPAQAQITHILMDEGHERQARVNLAQQRQSHPDLAVQLYLIEAESLTAADRLDEAWAVLNEALKKHPDDDNLLYSHAMLAEKRGQLDILEKNLRQIIKRDPNNAMALNALGYTLTNRTTRYAEARGLLNKAHRIAPNDPAILDSLGWLYYREGQLETAESYLQRAYAAFPDQEVAAHLGEVLWQQNKRSEARKIWRAALEEDKDAPLVRETLKRLTGSETP